MRMEEVMSRKVETTYPGETASEAWQRMRLRGVRHLVVKDGSEIVGILSDRDLGARSGAQVRQTRTVADLMSLHPVTVDIHTTVREAANLLRGRHIGCLPVTDGDRLKGIVTVTDLLDLIGRGAEKPIRTSTRWTLRRRGDKRKELTRRWRVR
jgi:acetoin utilization protein AcuB